MFGKFLKAFMIIPLLVFGMSTVLPLFPSIAVGETDQNGRRGVGMLLPNEHSVVGTVQRVTADLIEVNIGQLEPLFLSLKAAAENGISSIHRGDTLRIVVSDQNQVVGFHKADAPAWDRAIRGHLLQPLLGDHTWAVIQTDQGANETYKVDEKIRHTLMNIPVGVPAVFLLNKQNILIDATFGDEGSLLDTLAQWSKDRQRTVHF